MGCTLKTMKYILFFALLLLCVLSTGLSEVTPEDSIADTPAVPDEPVPNDPAPENTEPESSYPSPAPVVKPSPTPDEDTGLTPLEIALIATAAALVAIGSGYAAYVLLFSTGLSAGATAGAAAATAASEEELFAQAVEAATSSRDANMLSKPIKRAKKAVDFDAEALAKAEALVVELVEEKKEKEDQMEQKEKEEMKKNQKDHY